MLKPIVTFAIAAIAAGTPAHASERARTVAVSLVGLDPGRPQDARLIARRIAAATEAVCGSYAGVQAEEEAAIANCRAGVAQQVRRQSPHIELAAR